MATTVQLNQEPKEFWQFVAERARTGFVAGAVVGGAAGAVVGGSGTVTASMLAAPVLLPVSFVGGFVGSDLLFGQAVELQVRRSEMPNTPRWQQDFHAMSARLFANVTFGLSGYYATELAIASAGAMSVGACRLFIGGAIGAVAGGAEGTIEYLYRHNSKPLFDWANYAQSELGNLWNSAVGTKTTNVTTQAL